MLEYMYPQAVESGIPATEYWGMTLEEIMIQVQANKNPFLKQTEQAVEEAKTEEETKQEAMQREQEIFLAQAQAIKATRERRKLIEER